MLKFTLHNKDGHARRGTLELNHGSIETPVFMPVGTYGSVKAMTPQNLHDIKAQIILGNTYHLWLRPGLEVIEQFGGLHDFIGWNKPILTDSGGFQVFSLSNMRKLTEEGCTFKSPINGDKLFLSPEISMKIQTVLNSDIAMQLDRSLTTEIERRKAQNEDEKLVKFVEEEVLFPLRQKVMDFQQLLVVNQQGIVAMEVIRRNNLELIRAVDRAQSVTVSSLRVAVTVAGALYNQKIVLDKVKALNATTESMIASTSRMLKEQGTEIQRQATEATVSPETLKQAFADALGALDDISTYKQEALPRIAQTIQEFKQIAEKGEARLKQMEDAGAFDR